jgi:hypothetical protein
MGKKSGTDNVVLWSEELGIRLHEDEFREIVEDVRRQKVSLVS